MNISRSKITIVLLFLVIVGFRSRCYGQQAGQQPNVIVILTDDQGWGDLGYHGNTNLETPHLDRLAASGASFSNFYVSPVCSPTRAELLTGRYHPRGGVYSTSAGGERLDLDETTIAEVFSRAGYRTGIFGKWHNGMQYPYHPNGRGFDEFYGFASGHWGDYFSPQLLEHNGKAVQGEGYITNDLTDKALSFMRQHRHEPFFLYVPYNTPHSPMQVPDRWWNKLEDKKLDMRHRDPGKEDPEFSRAALAMVENIDWNVGRILETVRQLDLDNNTIVVYMSDNGPNSWRWNGGMRGRKGSTDEGGIRSPLFIRWPGKIAAGTRIFDISAAIDLLPTLADLAGVALQTAHPPDGISLAPLLLKQQRSRKNRLIFSHWNGRTSVRNSTYRLDHRGRLYNIKRDRGQRHDSSDQHPGLTRKLTRAVRKWEKQVLSALDEDEERPFPVGHPDFRYTQLPARDGMPHGNIRRSNRYPNASFFTGWTSRRDSITWNVDVRAGGRYKVEVYYTCAPEDRGSVISLSFKSHRLVHKVSRAHDPPLRGRKQDRVERVESYVKDFRPLELGVIRLEEGQGTLTLKALDIPGRQVMDVRTVMLTRVDNERH
ncbi:arylsulfatase [Fodinibius sediminis]|nr:arylsulfatase [Fodinibius sediminis]